MPNSFSVKVINDAIAATYIMLKAVSLRLGTCWWGGYDSNMVKRKLGVPESAAVYSALAIGYAETGGPNP